MLSVIINGSPRKLGITQKMITCLSERIGGDIACISAYESAVSPCRDCRYCWDHNECAIHDDMQEIYSLLNKADCIIIASPVYFHSVSGPLKTLIDRMQIYWAQTRREKPAIKKEFVKSGAFLLCGGAPAYPDQFVNSERIIRHVFKDLHVECLGGVVLPKTDSCVFEEEISMLQEIEVLANRIRDFSLKG